MAGSISLALTTIWNPVAKAPNRGGQVAFIQAGTTNTPQNAYYDQSLTQALPNPYTLLDGALMPYFYLADGFIKVRVTDPNGLELFVQDNIMVVGPSSGEGGGGGGGVDPTTVFATGDVMWQPVSGSRTGWVRDNGRTIGSATSGATERANADCEALFAFLWNKYSDTFCPVSTGRGASASADWSANKTIQLLDFRNCAPGGLDDMGASAAGGWASVPVVSGDAATAGSILGESLHQLLKAELPTDKPTGTITNGAITISPSSSPLVTGLTNGQSGGDRAIPTTTNTSITASQAASTFTGDALGSGTKMNVVQRTVLGTFYRKL
jgi:hypothetical protein